MNNTWPWNLHAARGSVCIRTTRRRPFITHGPVLRITAAAAKSSFARRSAAAVFDMRELHYYYYYLYTMRLSYFLRPSVCPPPPPLCQRISHNIIFRREIFNRFGGLLQMKDENVTPLALPSKVYTYRIIIYSMIKIWYRYLYYVGDPVIIAMCM